MKRTRAKSSIFIICPFSSVQNGNAELMISGLMPRVCHLLLESGSGLRRPLAFQFLF